MALLKQPAIAAALEMANRAREADPDNARVRLARSAVLSVQGKWAAAVVELESLPRQAWSPRFQLALADVYLRNDRPENALSVLDPLVKRFPSFVVARYLLAHAALAANRPDKALAELQEVRRAAPRTPTRASAWGWRTPRLGSSPRRWTRSPPYGPPWSGSPSITSSARSPSPASPAGTKRSRRRKRRGVSIRIARSR